MKKLCELKAVASLDEESGAIHVEGSCEMHEGDTFDKLFVLNSVVESLHLDSTDVMAFSIAKMQGVFDKGNKTEIIMPLGKDRDNES